MKKTILATAIILAFLISCNDTKQKSEKDKTGETTETVRQNETEREVSGTHSLDNVWVNKIKLDNGEKWRANPETTDGVEKMQSLIKYTDQKTVKDYHNLALELNEAKNFVVKKCTMKGASHDNLHIFLHPLIDKIEALGKVSTIDEGSKITKSISKNVSEYDNYFQ